MQAIMFKIDRSSFAEQLWLLENLSVVLILLLVPYVEKRISMVVELEAVQFEDQLRKLGEGVDWR